MPYTQVIDGCLTGAVGDHGLSQDQLSETLTDCRAGLEWLRKRHTDGGLPLLHLPERRDDLTELREVADGFQQRFDHVLVLGTGGSSLGGQTLYALADYGFGRPGGGPQLIFMDNIDPDGFAALAEAVDYRRLGVIVISKSGGTAETLTQMLTLVAEMTAVVGEDALNKHIATITEPGDRPLRALAGRWDLPVIDHDPGVGGRFSALSLVGLLPAMIAGLNVEAVREGAATVLNETISAAAPDQSKPAVGAAVSIGLLKARGTSTTVLMPYLDRLSYFGMWYRQLWAESLGKNGTGTTPIRAMGTVDQHSQLQLYLDGPRDKMFTVLMGKVSGTGGRVDKALADSYGLNYLGGRSMGDLLDAEQRATADTLKRNGRPTRVMQIESLDEFSMGALMMHFMLETIVGAHLLRVNAFDQPAVEEGKVLAREYLGATAAA